MLLHAPKTIKEEARAMAFELGMSPSRFDELPRGAYLGVFYLADVVDFEQEFIFAVVPMVSFDEPIPGSGKTNLFYPSDHEWKAIRKVLEATSFADMVKEYRTVFEE
jgi:hypothetical protein